MSSILKVDTIQDQSGNNIINESGDTITIGASGDTITIPSGATTTLTDGIAGDFKMNSGFGSIATAYGCRAWVNFDGTGTVAIRESGNVSSITDNGTGDYTINFTTAMPDVNYNAVFGSAQIVQENSVNRSITTTTFSIRTITRADSYTVSDEPYIFLAVFR